MFNTLPRSLPSQNPAYIQMASQKGGAKLLKNGSSFVYYVVGGFFFTAISRECSVSATT